MNKKERTRQWRPPHSFSHVLPASFICAISASFLFGAVWGRAEVKHLGNDMVNPHPSMRGGASWGHRW